MTKLANQCVGVKCFHVYSSGCEPNRLQYLWWKSMKHYLAKNNAYVKLNVRSSNNLEKLINVFKLVETNQFMVTHLEIAQSMTYPLMKALLDTYSLQRKVQVLLLRLDCNARNAAAIKNILSTFGNLQRLRLNVGGWKFNLVIQLLQQINFSFIISAQQQKENIDGLDSLHSTHNKIRSSIASKKTMITIVTSGNKVKLKGTIDEAKQKLEMFFEMMHDIIIRHEIPIDINMKLSNFEKIKTGMIESQIDQFGKKIKKEYVHSAVESEYFKVMSTPNIHFNEERLGIQTAMMKSDDLFDRS